MKKIFTIICMISAIATFAQTPETINFQAVARDASGNLLSNQSVNFRLSILQGGPSGTVVYSETQAKTTNEFGLVTLGIGAGNVVSGNFSTIDWGAASYWLKTEMDPTGGSDFQLMGTSQFLSVPYALYAKSSGSSMPVVTNDEMSAMPSPPEGKWFFAPIAVLEEHPPLSFLLMETGNP